MSARASGYRRVLGRSVRAQCPRRMALPKDIKWVTFDVYGTLIDWETGVYDAFAKEADRDGFTLDARRARSRSSTQIQREIKGGLLRALRRGPAPHRRRSRQGARLAARALALRLPARLRPALAAVQGDQPALEKFEKKFEIGLISNIDDKLLGQTRRHFGRLRPRRHRAAGPLLQARPRALQGVRAPHRHQEGLGPRRLELLPRRRAVPEGQGPGDLGQPAAGEQLEPSQKKPTAEVKTLREAAKLLGAA